jgi:poly-gamma-glutamate synthesis protein (capsule biosynthesis protein)
VAGAPLSVADPVDRPGAISVNDGFVAVGDIMLGNSAPCVGFGFHSRYPRDASAAFSSLTSLLQRGEIVMGNLECLLARTGIGSTRYRSDQMRGDPEYASNLRSAGFTAMSIANNHAMQHGIGAFESTVEFLEAAGIRCVGLRGKDEWCAQPAVQTTRNGLRVGLLGYSWRPRQYGTGEPPYAEGDVEAVLRDVTRLRRSTDAVIVSLHWGEEFLNLPSVAEVEAGRRIIDAGASVIVGHHPHVVRPVERYGNGIICYSLGNFVTDMIWQPALRSGAVLECKLSRGGGGVSDIGMCGTRVDAAFRARLDPLPPRIGEGPVHGLPEPEYRSRVARSVRRQRLSAYAYAARNLGRYPPAVLGELVANTLRNKVYGIISPDFDRPADGTHKEVDPARPEESRGPLSILHVVAPAGFGGLESVVRLLAAGQLRRGYSVRVAAVLSDLDNSPHPFVQALEAEGIPTIAFRLSDRDYRGERAAIRSLCRQHQPDVVHTHGFRSDVINGAVASAEGIAIVSTCHGFIDSDWRGRLYQWLQRRALRRFDAAIAVSTAIAARLRAADIPAAKIHLVPNCFSRQGEALTREEARRTLCLPDAPVIGWVGRLTNEKGADVALEAFAQLEHPTARLVIIGAGRDGEALRSRAAELGVNERVHWCGAIPNAGKLFPAFDVFLLSSRSEGTPIALFEAMAADVPIVATRVGGVPDVVDSSSAQLVDSENSKAIVGAVTEVFAHPDLARVRAARARKRLADRFDAEQWLAHYESIYHAVVRPQLIRSAS